VQRLLAGFDNFLAYGVAMGIAVFLVVLSQVKIDVTNACRWRASRGEGRWMDCASA
jgi:hypothetical protein